MYDVENPVVGQNCVCSGGTQGFHEGWEVWENVFQFVEFYQLMNIYIFRPSGIHQYNHYNNYASRFINQNNNIYTYLYIGTNR